MKARLMMRSILLLLAVMFGSACQAEKPGPSASTSDAAQTDAAVAKAYFAGGCFWCSESDFEKLDGVVEAVSGYMGGHVTNPTYKQVSSGGTGHAELVEVQYYPDQISYEQLLTHFWRSIDPLTPNAQFCDRGSQYRSAIFVNNEAERAAATASKTAVAKELGERVATEINDRSVFTRAEKYHQDYYKKNPIRYNYYRSGCGRDDRLEDVWGDKAISH